MTEKQQIKMVVFDWAGTTTDFGSQAPVDVLTELSARKGWYLPKLKLTRRWVWRKSPY